MVEQCNSNKSGSSNSQELSVATAYVSGGMVVLGLGSFALYKRRAQRDSEAVSEFEAEVELESTDIAVVVDAEQA